MARRAVGMTAARLLRERLQAHERPVVGLGWGRTMAAMVDQFSGVRKPEAIFVSAMGSLTLELRGKPLQGRASPHGADRRGGAFPAGALHRQQRARPRDPGVATHGAGSPCPGLTRRFSLTSLGECDGNAFLFENRYLSADELAELRDAGAVGDMLGEFFDQNGRLVDTNLNHRTLAIDLSHLRNREVVLLCAGRTEARAARSILRTGVVNGLIIDGDTALQISG